jgi:hypothetical protein
LGLGLKFCIVVVRADGAAPQESIPMCKKESRQKETRALLTILCKTNETCTLLLKFRLRLKQCRKVLHFVANAAQEQLRHFYQGEFSSKFAHMQLSIATIAISYVFIQILALASCKESDAAVVLQCIMQASSKFREQSEQSEDPGDHSGNHSSDAGEDQLSNGESQAAGEQLSNGESQAAGEYAVC